MGLEPQTSREPRNRAPHAVGLRIGTGCSARAKRPRRRARRHHGGDFFRLRRLHRPSCRRWRLIHMDGRVQRDRRALRCRLRVRTGRQAALVGICIPSIQRAQRRRRAGRPHIARPAGHSLAAGGPTPRDARAQAPAPPPPQPADHLLHAGHVWACRLCPARRRAAELVLLPLPLRGRDRPRHGRLHARQDSGRCFGEIRAALEPRPNASG